MHVHPDLTTALLAEHQRDLRTRAELRGMLPTRERRLRSAGKPPGRGARFTLPALGAMRLSR
jgi:hypothetical protein